MNTEKTSLENKNKPSCLGAVVRSASEIELRLKNLKLDQADCKEWYEDAYAKYESDRKYWGRGEADPTEYLEANRQLVELNVQIYQLEWVLGLRP